MTISTTSSLRLPKAPTGHAFAGFDRDAADKLSADMRNEDVIGYRSTNQVHDGRWRKIKVKLRPPQSSIAPMSSQKADITFPTNEH